MLCFTTPFLCQNNSLSRSDATLAGSLTHSSPSLRWWFAPYSSWSARIPPVALSVVASDWLPCSRLSVENGRKKLARLDPIVWWRIIWRGLSSLYTLTKRHWRGEPNTNTEASHSSSTDSPATRRASHGGATWATRGARVASLPVTLMSCRHAAPVASGGESMAKVPHKQCAWCGSSRLAEWLASAAKAGMSRSCRCEQPSSPPHCFVALAFG